MVNTGKTREGINNTQFFFKSYRDHSILYVPKITCIFKVHSHTYTLGLDPNIIILREVEQTSELSVDVSASPISDLRSRGLLSVSRP